MDKIYQQKIWAERTSASSIETILDAFRSPCTFQTEFADYMNKLGASLHLPKRTHVRICELGGEFGVTTLLLSEEIFERHVLDLNPKPLNLLAQAAHQLGQTVQVHIGDMFKTGWADEMFDVVFSNGVLEHYDKSQRVNALREAARMTRPGGFVIVGVPNHCSLPYRFAYLLRRVTGSWNFPPEELIRDFSTELKQVNTLRAMRTLLFDQESVFAILPKARFTAWPFRLLHRFMKFEPYLRVFEMERV